MIANESLALKGEPAVIIGAVVAVLQIVLSILAGTTDTVDGSTAIAGVVIGVVFPFVQALATRQKVTPVVTAPQVDSL